MLFDNKKGYSTAMSWVFGIVSLFGLGVLTVVFNQVFYQYLVPTIKNQVNSTTANVAPATVTTIFSNIDKFMSFWQILPFVIFGMIILFLIVTSLRKEGESF